MDQSFMSYRSEICEQILERVASRKNKDPTELPPLYNAVDPDALENVFAPTEHEEREGWIIFSYDEFTVIVNFDGDVEVEIRSEEKSMSL